MIAAVIIVLAKKGKKNQYPQQGMMPQGGAQPYQGGVQPIGVTQAVPAAPSNDIQTMRLQATGGYFANRRFPVAGGLVLGRDPSRCNMAYPKDYQGISGAHCRLFNDGGVLYLEDCGSSYGTFCKGRKLAAGERVALTVGDTFYLANPAESFKIDRSSRA